MKNRILITLFSLSTLLFSACANDDTYQTPKETLKTYEFTTTTTVLAVKTNSPFVVTDGPATDLVPPVEITADDIIEAYVTSSDEKGTFYKSVSFQTLPTDGSDPIGFSVPINITTTFGKGFNPGRKVYIKLKGLYSGIVYGSLQIGSLFEGSVGRISETEWQKYLFPSATVVNEDDFVRPFSLNDAYVDNIQNRLIELTNVQFEEGSLNRTYYDVDSGGGATNHTLGSTVLGGGSGEIIRFSSFAPFTGKSIPSGSGKIRGVLTKYQDTFQFIVRYENDIKLNGPRIYISSPIGGTTINFAGSLTEPFTSYTLNASVFPNYINDQTSGNRYWQVKQFPSGTGNKYIEMTSFGGGGVNAKTYFFVPVDFTAANTFTFKEEIRYYRGGVALKVYYVKSENYISGGLNINSYVDITKKFNISYPTLGTSENSFNSAGTYAIPASLTGTGYFVFEYIGTPELTSTVQLDDITIN
jgi:Family of unknown function (DUF5689)